MADHGLNVLSGNSQSETPRRPVRSFVVRSGRITARQREAIDTLWPRFGVSLPDRCPANFWEAQFGDVAGPLTLEIGFGMGHSLLEMAARDPDRRFVGAEVHTPGIGALLAGIEQRGLNNLRVIDGDIQVLLDRAFAAGELDRVQIFFPDPWPKKRHHKRRMIQPAFCERLAGRVRPGGHLRLATDWQPYADWMLKVLEASPDWRNLGGTGGWLEDRGDRPESRFEARGVRRGHAIRDLLFENVRGEKTS